jgi:hypothetical protein
MMLPGMLQCCNCHLANHLLLLLRLGWGSQSHSGSKHHLELPLLTDPATHCCCCCLWLAAAAIQLAGRIEQLLQLHAPGQAAATASEGSAAAAAVTDMPAVPLLTGIELKRRWM